MGEFSKVAKEVAERRNLGDYLMLAVAGLLVVLYYLAWPWHQIAQLWRQRRRVWALLDKCLRWFGPWRKFNAWRRKRIVARCDRKRHTIQGTLLPSGAPGKMCQQCGYVQQISPKEFKKLFGISVDTAIRRAQNRGHNVENAKAWAARHGQ